MTAIYQFNADAYTRNEVEDFTIERCEELSYKDTKNVTKFDLADIRRTPKEVLVQILNEEYLDTANSWYTIF